MKKKVLLFDDELDKLKQTGWDYEMLYGDDDKRIYVVNMEIPKEISKHL